MESVQSGNPWIVDEEFAPDKPLDSAVLTRLKHFSAMNKLKKMALRVCLIIIIQLILFCLISILMLILSTLWLLVGDFKAV